MKHAELHKKLVRLARGDIDLVQHAIVYASGGDDRPADLWDVIGYIVDGRSRAMKKLREKIDELPLERRERIAYAAGFNVALVLAERAVRVCPSLDENGYICEKSDAIKAIQSVSESQKQSDAATDNNARSPVGEVGARAVQSATDSKNV